MDITLRQTACVDLKFTKKLTTLFLSVTALSDTVYNRVKSALLVLLFGCEKVHIFKVFVTDKEDLCEEPGCSVGA